MLRLALAFACTIAALAAVETPLTLNIGQGNRVLVVDPAYGSLTIYELSQARSNRVTGVRTPQANFITDLDVMLKTYLTEQEGVPIAALRTGSLNTKPQYGEMFTKLMSDKPTPSEAKAGKKALRYRATAAEAAFWKGELAYDGVVRAAISGNSQYLLLGIPSLHVLMLYQIDGEAVSLKSFRNYGPELLMTGWNTLPSPKDLLQEVLRVIPKEREEEARKALGVEDEAAAKQPEAAPAAGAAEEQPTPKSDLWIGPGAQNSFVVFDIANTRAMLYLGDGALQLMSVRDLKIDLVIPGLVGGSLKSDPVAEDLLKQFLQARKEYVAKYALPTERDEILMLVDKRQPKGKTSPFEAVSSTAGLTMANFVDRRVFLTFEQKGGQALNLVGARDYSLDIAVALLDQEILDRERAKNNLVSAGKQAGAGARASALLTLKQALTLDPTLHKEAERQFKTAFAKDAAQQAEFQALLDAAAKKAEALAAEIAERKKALEEKRKKDK